MARLTELPVSEELHIADVQRSDPVHLAEVADDGGDIVLRVGAQGTGAQADGVRRAVVQLHDAVEACLVVGQTRKPEDRPCRIVRMAGHLDANFLADRDDSIQEVLVVLGKLVLVDLLIALHGLLQLSKTLRLPARHGEALGILQGVLHQLDSGQALQLGIVIVQGVGAVLRDLSRKVRAEPVEDRHEVVDDDLDADLREVPDGLDVSVDVLVSGGQAHLDVLVDVDGLDDLALQTGFLDVLHIGADLFLRPDLACRLIVKEAHDAGHSRDLPDLLQGHRITVLSVPAECHLHIVFLLLIMYAALLFYLQAL